MDAVRKKIVVVCKNISSMIAVNLAGDPWGFNPILPYSTEKDARFRFQWRRALHIDLLLRSHDVYSVIFRCTGFCLMAMAFMGLCPVRLEHLGLR